MVWSTISSPARTAKLGPKPHKRLIQAFHSRKWTCKVSAVHLDNSPVRPCSASLSQTLRCKCLIWAQTESNTYLVKVSSSNSVDVKTYKTSFPVLYHSIWATIQSQMWLHWSRIWSLSCLESKTCRYRFTRSKTLTQLFQIYPSLSCSTTSLLKETMTKADAAIQCP